MSIRAIILAGLLGMPLLAGSALAADTAKLSLAEAAKLGKQVGEELAQHIPSKNKLFETGE